MEAKQWLATGHARTAHARARCKQAWVEISSNLNKIDDEGCIKSWQQWQKYWKDKKGAVKRKCSTIAFARRNTEGDMDEVAELSHVEERIVSIIGAKTYTPGQQHILVPIRQVQNMPAVAIAEEDKIEEKESPVTLEVEISGAPDDETCRTSEVEAGNSAGGERRRWSHRSQRRLRNSRLGGTFATQRRLLQRLPSQRRSAMASLAEKFIAIEERRTETEALIAYSQQATCESIVQLAQAFTRTQHENSESIKQLAHAFNAQAQAINNLAEAIKSREIRVQYND